MKHLRETPGRHRQTRPRYGRISVFGAAVAITAIAVAGALGSGGSVEQPDKPSATSASSATSTPSPAAPTEPAPQSTLPEVDPQVQVAAISQSTALPQGSGQGRRVVFSEGRQRVWLVGADDRVQRTHLASGSIYDNLDPGTYEVYSRSRHAIGIDDSGTMEYFVRFTQGDQGAAIGFHTIPVDDGRPVQTLAELGTPLSHGCIRQKRSDAIAVWEFAPVGTTVVVTA